MSVVTTRPGDRAQVRSDLGALARDARQRSRLQRLLLQALIAAIAGVWIGWWGLAWLALMQFLERVAEPWFAHNVVAGLGPREAARAKAMWRALTASAFLLSWAPAWSLGGDSAAFFAAAMMSGALINALVYFSNDPLTFYAAVAPPIAAAVSIPLLAHTWSVWNWLTLAVIAVTLVRAHWARGDQIALIEALDRNRALRKQAEEANKAKTQFLATMSHELRTPLNAILNYAEILHEDLDATGQKAAAADAARILGSGRTLLALVNDVLDFSMLEANQIKPSCQSVCIEELLGAVIEEFQTVASARGNSLSLQRSAPAAPIVTDAGRLRQCLRQLISNACKFTDHGQIAVSYAVQAGECRIDVTDTGCGIAPEDQNKLFEPFAQADATFTRARDGAGLGLAVAKRIARLLGGDLVATSVAGEGSCFSLTIAPHAAGDDQRQDQNSEGDRV